MSEQKPKIDLKSRLGKKPAASAPAVASAPIAAPSSIPPPMGVQRPSAPQARMPAPAFGGGAPQYTPSGIPAPPFRQPSAAPQIDPSNPYGALPAQAAPARPQAIRVELGEEVHEARRSGRKKVMMLALVTAAVGGVIGFAVGGGAERAAGAESAVVGAQALIKDIEKANGETQKLADALKAAKEKLVKGQYPEKEVSDLGAINIPFSGTNLAGKGIGRFQGDTVTMLLQYAGAATEANAQKEKLQNVLNGAKGALTEMLAQKEKPQVRWMVLIAQAPGGPMGGMQLLPKAFPMMERWPEEVKIGSGKSETTVKRYTSGNPVSSEKEPLFIPIDPSSQNSVCPSDVIVRLRRELNDLETVLRGDNTPGEEKTGLIDSSRKLVEKLKLIGKTS